MQKSINILKNEDVETDLLKIADYNITRGMNPDMGNGDEGPEVPKKQPAQFFTS